MLCGESTQGLNELIIDTGFEARKCPPVRSSGLCSSRDNQL
jgi:hypothetical protein